MTPRTGIKRIPWFMYAIYDASIDSIGRSGLEAQFAGASLNFITSDSVPTEVKDSKKLNYYEQQIPGGYTSIHKYGSSSARMLSFKIELADFNEDFGLSKKLAQLDLLRRPELNLISKVSPPDPPGTPSPEIQTTRKSDIFAPRYNPFYGNPYVIMWHSTFDTIMLAYTVLKCDFTTSKPNRLGKPQYAIVDFELAEREDHILSIVEHKLKKVLALFGAVGSVQNLIKNLKKANLPRNVYKDYKLKNFGF